MLKSAIIGVAVASLALSGTAYADVRPTAANFQPTTSALGAALPAPAKTVVRKRSNLAPLLIVVIVVATIGAVGGIASSLSSSSPG